MIQLRPTENFTIVRVIGDTQDATTYYVQAIVRDSNTDEIIKTVNLTDQGSRRFTGDYEIPADVSGEGFYIDITTTIYTDSGYTTEAGDYAEESEQYLVQDRYNRTFGLGGGGMDVDYKKIQKMIDNAIKQIVIPEQEKVNLVSLETGVRRVISQVDNIKFPEQIKTDLSGVITAIKEAKSAIDNKYIPEQKEVDLNPIATKNSEDNKNTLDDVRNMLSEVLKAIQSGNKDVSNNFNKLKSKFDLTSKMRNLFNEANDEFSQEEKPKKQRRFIKKV